MTRTWTERKRLFERVKKLERRFGIRRFQPLMTRWYAWCDRQEWTR